jgi:Protein of unknown function (DUF2886).
MRWRALFLSLAAATGLGGCAGLGLGGEGPLARFVPGSEAEGRSDQDRRIAALVTAGQPVLQLGLVEQQSTTLSVREASRGGMDSYITADGLSIAFRDGMVVSMKGGRFALMGADVAQPAALLRRRQPGASDRFHSYLTGTDEIVTRTYRCVIEDRGPRSIEIADGTRSTRLMAEVCRSLTDEFTNLYWVAADGQIVQSRQWIDPENGALSVRIVPRAPT